MHKVVLSDVAMQMLTAKAADSGARFKASEKKQQKDGRWLIEVDDEVFERLETKAPFDVSDAILAITGEAA